MQLEFVSKTQSTVEAYNRINQGNLRYAALMRERGDMGDVTDRNLMLAIAVADLEPRVQPSTARQYRAAAIYAIKSEPGDCDQYAFQILQPEMTEDETEKQHRLAQLRTELLTELRGSQQRAEHLSDNDWKIFLTALNKSSNPWGPITALWFACTLITGLRPCEWATAKMQDRTLVVFNAKATNGRAFGPSRTLDLCKADANALRLIEAFLKIVAARRGDLYADMYNGARNLITKVARNTLSRRSKYPTLYTARHAFSSKAKTVFSKQEVAALMGHASSETAPRHYAAARHARGGQPLQVEPSVQDVRAVQRLEAVKVSNSPVA